MLLRAGHGALCCSCNSSDQAAVTFSSLVVCCVLSVTPLTRHKAQLKISLSSFNSNGLDSLDTEEKQELQGEVSCVCYTRGCALGEEHLHNAEESLRDAGIWVSTSWEEAKLSLQLAVSFPSCCRVPVSNKNPCIPSCVLGTLWPSLTVAQLACWLSNSLLEGNVCCGWAGPEGLVGSNQTGVWTSSRQQLVSIAPVGEI